MDNRKIRVAITQGDTNGIGYELIFKTFADQEMLDLCTPVIYGSPKIAAYHRKALDMQANFSIIANADEIRDGRVNLLTCFDDEVKVEIGTPTPESGNAALKALDRAMTDYRNNAYDVLVSCPLDNKNTGNDDIPFKSVSEYVSTSIGDGVKAVSMYINDNLRIASATEGVSMKDVASKITEDNISDKIKMLFSSMRRDFMLSEPRIALLGLNLSSDGSEDKTVLTAAAEKATENGQYTFGPYKAGTFFEDGYADSFDAILAMYDDQAIIPFRTLTNGYGIVYLAGLPLVCTAPAQDPSFCIAGKGVADPTDLRHAIYAAIDIFRNRKEYDRPYADPLQKLYHEKRDESEKVRFSVQKKMEKGGRDRSTISKNRNDKFKPKADKPAIQPETAAPATAKTEDSPAEDKPSEKAPEA